MNQNTGEKEVRFDVWCNKCLYKDECETDVNSPCFDCLYQMSNTYTTTPINYILKEE